MSNTERYPKADNDILNLSWKIKQSIYFYSCARFSLIVAHYATKKKCKDE